MSKDWGICSVDPFSIQERIIQMSQVNQFSNTMNHNVVFFCFLHISSLLIYHAVVWVLSVLTVLLYICIWNWLIEPLTTVQVNREMSMWIAFAFLDLDNLQSCGFSCAHFIKEPNDWNVYEGHRFEQSERWIKRIKSLINWFVWTHYTTPGFRYSKFFFFLNNYTVYVHSTYHTITEEKLHL